MFNGFDSDKYKQQCTRSEVSQPTKLGLFLTESIVTVRRVGKENLNLLRCLAHHPALRVPMSYQLKVEVEKAPGLCFDDDCKGFRGGFRTGRFWKSLLARNSDFKSPFTKIPMALPDGYILK